MGNEFSITPRAVATVETKYRRIVTPLPHPDSMATLEKLREFEPQFMRGQLPVVWDCAEDILFSTSKAIAGSTSLRGCSSSTLANYPPDVKRAILDQVNSGLLLFPAKSAPRW